MRFFFLAFLLSIVTVISIFGFRGHKFTDPPAEIFNDMDDQPRINYQSASAFFTDGIGSRPPVPGTLPMGYEIPFATTAEKPTRARIEFSLPGDYYHTGRFGEYYGDGIPDDVKLDAAFLERGRERYGIHCGICHGKTGDGNGVVKNYMPVPIANLHDAKFSDSNSPEYRPDGEIFEVITKGRGLMGSYGANINVRDRWAIIAYLRALQDAKKKADGAVAAPETTSPPAPAN